MAHRNRQHRHQVEDAPEADPERRPVPPVAGGLLALQRSAGNAAVASLLNRAAVGGSRLHRRLLEEWQAEQFMQHGVVDEPPAQAEAPAAQAPAAPPDPAKEAEFAARGEAAAKEMDAAGYKQADPLPGRGTAPLDVGSQFPKWFADLQHKLMMSATWGPAQEVAQQVLDEYANWLIATRHGGRVPANLRFLFEYVGRSSPHSAGARKQGWQGVADSSMGGGLIAPGKPTKNWCTQATTTGILDAMRRMGLAPQDPDTFFRTVLFKKVDGEKLSISGETAYDARLLPGDMVMYLFDNCQYGGHTVTVVDDYVDSFTHVSGNTGGTIGVGVGEAKRLKHPPRSKTGVKFDLQKCNQHGTPEKEKAATEFIKNFDFGPNMKLVYSIVRFSGMFREIESIPTLPPEEQGKMLLKWNLRRVKPIPGPPPAPAPAAAAAG